MDRRTGGQMDRKPRRTPGHEKAYNSQFLMRKSLEGEDKLLSQYCVHSLYVASRY